MFLDEARAVGDADPPAHHPGLRRRHRRRGAVLRHGVRPRRQPARDHASARAARPGQDRCRSSWRTRSGSSRRRPAGCTTRTSSAGPGGEPLHIVHRDVSPSNVLVTYDGAVKVSDFGIAKWASSARRRRRARSRASSPTCRPSSAAASPLDRRSDVFALGTILYELTTGEPALPRRQRLRDPEPDRHRRAAAARAGPRTGPYPPALGAIVMRALALAPDERYPTAQALQLDARGVRAAGAAWWCRRSRSASSCSALFADDRRLAARRSAPASRWAAPGRGRGARRRSTRTIPASAPPPTPSAATRRRARAGERRVRALGLAAFAAVFALAGALAAKAWASHQRAPAPAIASRRVCDAGRAGTSG